jgi:dynein heavy chain
LKYEDFRDIIETTEGQTNNQVTELRKANFIRKNTAIWHMV